MISKKLNIHSKITYSMLLGVKTVSRMFYRFDVNWVGNLPKDPWSNLKLVLILNHTSLYEPLFAGWVPKKFLKNVSYNGLVPVADKTTNRPLVGRFFKGIAKNVVPVSRLRDRTWDKFVSKIKAQFLVVMLPEGRMKRANGLDSEGQPMTVRGGVADLLERIPGGRMLIAYSGGLHHVQIPNQLLPRLFKTLRMRVEAIDIEKYKDWIKQHRGELSFKQAVIQDLEARKLAFCPAETPLLTYDGWHR